MIQIWQNVDISKTLIFDHLTIGINNKEHDSVNLYFQVVSDTNTSQSRQSSATQHFNLYSRVCVCVFSIRCSLDPSARHSLRIYSCHRNGSKPVISVSVMRKMQFQRHTHARFQWPTVLVAFFCLAVLFYSSSNTRQ